ncbi:MAG: hypothetical protein JNL67_02330 [Planctomycetaceae bacterium]|nr:hypothetical protein [Planctomycetaceae bacterium]
MLPYPVRTGRLKATGELARIVAVGCAKLLGESEMAAKKSAGSKLGKAKRKQAMGSGSLHGSEKAIPPRKSPTAKATIRANLAEGGPLNLEQALEIVQTVSAEKLPTKRHAKRAAKKASTLKARTASRAKAASDAELPTVESVGIARENLAQHQQDLIDKRTNEYTALMRLLKKHGVASGAAAPQVRSGPKRGMTVRTAGRSVENPLQVFAEGDSWFDYPVPFFGGGVIPRLQRLLGVPILNLAKAGEEVRMMLGVKQRELIAKRFRNGCPAGGAWDAMLFSGGGNDIVGEPMSLWVREFRPGVPPEQFLHQSRFASALAIVQAGYEDLIQMRDELSPATHLFFHTYDFAIPDGRGVCHLGPWLKPTFQLRKFPSTVTVASEVVKLMLRQFASMLKSLAATRSQITVLETQGTLGPSAASWHNELHPSAAGFDQIVKLFHRQLVRVFPDRIPD